MSEKGKARKLGESRGKPGRTHSGGMPTMGGPAGMVPHHNYGIPSHSGGGLAYRAGLGPLMGQSIPMGAQLAGLSNDMGPPIFMPSLNLGTPKHPGNSGGTLPPNSMLKQQQQPNMSTSTAFMTTYPQAPPLSAFHSAYITAATLSSSAGKQPCSAALTTSIAKPIPVPHPMALVTKVVAMDRESPQPAFATGGGGGGVGKPSPAGVAKLLGPTSEGGASGGVKGESIATMSYYSSPAGLTQPSNSLSKMLMAPSPAALEQQEQAMASQGSLVSKPLCEGAYSSLMGDAFSVMVPVGSTPATSGQPSSNVTFADMTRLDRPPQPSAPHPPPLGVPPKEQRLTTAEVASNIIISNPGLTGKHIAAMTNCSQQPSPLLPNSAYSSPISSAEMLAGPALCSVPLNQHMDGGWGFPPQHNSFHNALSPPVSMTTASAPGGAGQDVLNQQTNGGGLKARLESAVPPGMPQSPLSGGGATSGGDSGMQNSPGQLNSSPRPRILRGKRPLDGNWKFEGQPNSLHSPGGSPHRTKLQANLKMAAVTSGVCEQPPSPSPEGTSSLNHVGGARVEELSASPRKKPRKQNVVANDDQYASNVPDTLQQLIQQSEDARLALPDDPKPPGCEVGHVPDTKPGGCEVGHTPVSKDVEIRYLAQLRRSPYPINGVYKLRHQVAQNHFRRYADVKHKAALPMSVYDLANDKTSLHRASGWKLHHFNSQLEEVGKVETEGLLLMEEIRGNLDELMQDSACLLDGEALSSTRELMQGNIDRCNRVKCHLESTATNMFMVLDQKSQVGDVLDKYSDFKSHYSSISPSLSSSSSSHHHKSLS